jgi:hypothetical protein
MRTNVLVKRVKHASLHAKRCSCMRSTPLSRGSLVQRVLRLLALLQVDGRYSVYLLYWYKSTDTDARCSCMKSTGARGSHPMARRGTPIYLLYWYKSTNTDALLPAATHPTSSPPQAKRPACTAGTQFTCFTGTKVQILTHCRTPPAVYRSAFERKALGGARGRTRKHSLDMADDFGSVMHESPHMHAKQSRSPSPLVYPNLASGGLLYWYKSTDADVLLTSRSPSPLVYPNLASGGLLYWYKSTDADVLLTSRSPSPLVYPNLASGAPELIPQRTEDRGQRRRSCSSTLSLACFTGTRVQILTYCRCA